MLQHIRRRTRPLHVRVTATPPKQRVVTTEAGSQGESSRPSATQRCGIGTVSNASMMVGRQLNRNRPTLRSRRRIQANALPTLASKDELIAEHLRRFDPAVLRTVSTTPTSHPANGSSPRSRSTRRCARSSRRRSRSRPQRPARTYTRDYNEAFAARLTDAARWHQPRHRSRPRRQCHSHPQRNLSARAREHDALFVDRREPNERSTRGREHRA